MARANAAYYASRDPFADFTTSPEISQVFGELLGLWCAIVWEQIGRPAPVVLAEAGPGRGTLMADALRAIGQAAPGFRAALGLHLIETSPRLREEQARRLPAETSWHERIDTLPEGPLLLLGNEFLDALPIRQFVRHADGWLERHVENGHFVEIPFPSRSAEGPDLLPPSRSAGGAGGGPPASPPPALPDGASVGSVVERCEPAQAIVRALAARIRRTGGAALFLDYGGATGDTLQAIRDGKPADPLADPGRADLTAHVDFPALAAFAQEAGAAVFGPEPQGLFLARLGLFQRTDRLARGKTPRDAGRLIAAARRLAEPDRMGRLFNALAICHPDAPAPPGFGPDPSSA